MFNEKENYNQFQKKKEKLFFLKGFSKTPENKTPC